MDPSMEKSRAGGFARAHDPASDALCSVAPVACILHHHGSHRLLASLMAGTGLLGKLCHGLQLQKLKLQVPCTPMVLADISAVAHSTCSAENLFGPRK